MSPNGTDDDGDDLAAPRPTMNGTQSQAGTDEIEKVDPTKERKLLARECCWWRDTIHVRDVWNVSR